MAREIDHHADRELGDRGIEAGRCARDEDAVAACRLDVDVSDVHRATQEGDRIRGLVEEFPRPRRLPVRDDDVAAFASAARPSASSTRPVGLITTSAISRSAATARGP